MNSGWVEMSGGLLMRQDDFSWQGAVQGDTHFFLRRSKDKPDEISDALWGSTSDSDAAMLLASFVEKSGGLISSEPGQARLVFRSVFTRVEGAADGREQISRLLRIVDEACVRLGVHLQQATPSTDGPSTRVVCLFTDV